MRCHGSGKQADLLIADEPTTALDVTIQDQILRRLRELEKEYGTSIIFITHDLGVVAELCDRVAVMYGGLIMEEALIDDLFEKPGHPYAPWRFVIFRDLRTGAERAVKTPLQDHAGYDQSPKGCRATRCPYAALASKEELPGCESGRKPPFQMLPAVPGCGRQLIAKVKSTKAVSGQNNDTNIFGGQKPDQTF